MAELSREPDDRVVLTLRGDVDLESVPEPNALLETLRHFRVRVLVVDLEQVRFMDSTGLAFLDQLQRAAQARGVAVRLRGVRARIHTLLAMTAMDTRFPMDPSLTA